MPMFIAALFIISKMWKTFKYLPNEWIHKMYIYSIKYYLAIERKRVLMYVTAQMNLENNMLSAIRQTPKDKSHILSFI